jgi:hypothetical protein
MECTALVHVASSLRGFLHSFQFWCADLRTASLLFAWFFAFLPKLWCADLRTAALLCGATAATVYVVT